MNFAIRNNGFRHQGDISFTENYKYLEKEKTILERKQTVI